MGDSTPIEFRPGRADEEPRRGLVAAMGAEIAELYDGLDFTGPDMPRLDTGPRRRILISRWLGRRS